MKFSVTYPIVTHPAEPSMLTGDAVRRFATAAEGAGFDGVGFTDHPAPTDRWLSAGGHDSFDPFVALMLCAAVTERLRLIPNIVVLPYRHPFVVAKAAATLQALSDGRFTLAVGTGYLKGEFRALGVDFGDRNDVFDEAIEAIRRIWTEDDVVMETPRWNAVGQTAEPKPGPPPPIWIGGNSRLSRRRVATLADGWRPFPAPRMLASTARTPALENAADLSVMLDELWAMVDEAGRDRSEIDISFGGSAGGTPGTDDFDPAARLESLDELATLGVTWADVQIPGDTIDHAIEGLEQFGEDVIGRVD